MVFVSGFGRLRETGDRGKREARSALGERTLYTLCGSVNYTDFIFF